MSLLIGTASIFFAVSCEKGETQTDAPENFVNISISGVSDGHFTVDFQAGKSTKTIEYAVCRAVNMKADSVAFMEGSLDNIQQAVPGEDGKVSVHFDFSKPLDFGPYTVYARAISESGQASRFVKEQVCALTTGVTVKYVSRSHYRLKASYHGNEFIADIFRQSKQQILNSYGSIEGFIDYMIKHDLNDPTNNLSFKDGDEWIEKFFYYTEKENGMYGISKATPDDQLVGFVTSDGTKITGAYAFEIPLQEYDPLIPLPDSLEVEIDYSNPATVINEYEDVTITEEYIPITISMGNNTDCYYLISNVNFTSKDTFWEFFREIIVPQLNNAFQSEEDMAKFYLTGNLYLGNPTPRTNNIYNRYDSILWWVFHTTHEYSNGESDEFYKPELFLIACPTNWNNERLIGFIEVQVPEEYLKGAGTTGVETTGMDKKVRFTAPVTYFPEISPCKAMQPAQ
ncbi:MAG: hypothetical protein IAB93_01920 [Bacteroidetes bacterium]|uniref:Uncharacterized protein n=1 Tax=Candidatus Merdivivens pullistercoris TaxID=2840873 RepID=A0A9D9I2M3_9BACT|nr:hypothetical protein [Candidatus Merdivivens pullistercoris]